MYKLTSLSEVECFPVSKSKVLVRKYVQVTFNISFSSEKIISVNQIEQQLIIWNNNPNNWQKKKEKKI